MIIKLLKYIWEKIIGKCCHEPGPWIRVEDIPYFLDGIYQGDCPGLWRTCKKCEKVYQLCMDNWPKRTGWKKR